MSASTPASSRTSRAAASSSLSPGSTCPLGSARTWRPDAVRRVGTMTIVSSPRTTTPPAECSRSRRRRPSSVDIPLQGDGVVHREPTAALGDDARALQGGEEPAGRLPARTRQLGQVGLRGGDEHVALAGALVLGDLDELLEDGGDPALDRLEALAGEALVGL